ncbi:Hypothetical predicted protein [Paramuricea clavata]|uniref:Uncharacterized protein n=1 Tax=Paramuricea clavata TaxID=317549 RepID=A0A7D9M1B5_PARCT|nr:Hypothetical predicted protein [Paramuricea clavata]
MAVVEILEKLKCVYANAANNQDVTFTYGIERTKTTAPIQNDVNGTTGKEPSNTDKENFNKLRDKFLSEVSYNKGHGTIYRLDSGHWRIDQQNNSTDFFNIQFQVGENTFANVVVYPIIVPKPAQGEHINMDMKVFAQREGRKAGSATSIKRVYDVEELDSYKKEESRINMAKRVNKYVGEALTESLYKKLKYEIRVVLLKQN